MWYVDIGVVVFHVYEKREVTTVPKELTTMLSIVVLQCALFSQHHVIERLQTKSELYKDRVVPKYI